MVEESVTIINKLGLHARAAAKFVNVASQFGAQIRVIKGPKEVDGKSIMSVMMLAAAQGTELSLRIDGKDELAALTAIKELIANRFDEAE
ncbi:HPr family phosphocarrier protein [Gynuella sunshinyii]|uniref:Phosphotransferase system, HPr-related protein n=1 Tax=Gynuella sunshinyii YC6258 TaxID=1445510 RepID=A0A0C5VT56_9GAMM|nr:HPr family phosphocarrier protein [Gynuella sunshinyii]AJQ96513.1 phosphotransferase system, HPr-related protein [Gynuella sunshinyii YC6258]